MKDPLRQHYWMREDEEKKRGRLEVAAFIFIISLSCLLVSAFLFVMCFMHEKLIGRASHWPIVEGHIISSEMVLRGGKVRSYCASASYGYKVNHVDYVGHRVEVSGRCVSEWFVLKHPEKAIVDVYFDPMDPSSSALEVDTASLPALREMMKTSTHYFFLLLVIAIFCLRILIRNREQLNCRSDNS